MRKSRVTGLARVALAGAVLALCALPVILSSSSASASTLDGAATITNQTLSPLASGASTTEFSVALPVNAVCSGDTASHGYHVFSYLVPKSTTISSITFTSHPSTGYGLVNNVGVYYGSANTANTTGQIISVPTNFEFAPLLSDGATLSSLLYSAGTSGVWEGGLACANSSGTLTDYWNTQVTFSASGSDPNGFTWNAYQVVPILASATTSASAAFTSQLSIANASGAVTYTVTGPASGISVSSTGAVTTTGTRAAGLYTVSGTDTDTGGDAGTWSLTITVTAVTLAQAAPTSASVTTSASSTFTSALHVAHSNGTLSYAVTTPATGISVSSTGAIATTGTLTPGIHTVSGTDNDSDGDTGTWSFPLTVSAGTLTQAAPTTASAVTTASGTFTDQLAVTGASGTVTYVVTTPATGISVSSTGAIATTGTLTLGTHTVSGTDADTEGDSGTWSFALTVSPAPDTFTSATSTSATVGSNFSFTVSTFGSPTPKLKESGKLPKGVKFNKGLHVLGGIPTSTKHKSAAGTYFVTFTATFGKGKTKVITTQAFTLTVVP